jgi:hypothetical protein
MFKIDIHFLQKRFLQMDECKLRVVWKAGK